MRNVVPESSASVSTSTARSGSAKETRISAVGYPGLLAVVSDGSVSASMISCRVAIFKMDTITACAASGNAWSTACIQEY